MKAREEMNIAELADELGDLLAEVKSPCAMGEPCDCFACENYRCIHKQAFICNSCDEP